MKVKELIAVLQGLDQDLDVMVKGYEGGYEDVGEILKEKVVLNYNTESYYGPHEEFDQRKHEGRSYEIVEAYVITEID